MVKDGCADFSRQRAQKFYLRSEPKIHPHMEREIILEMSKLLEKTGIDNLGAVVAPSEKMEQALETALINLKSLNARYEKNEALNQVQWLMNNYNIQIDELLERISA